MKPSVWNWTGMMILAGTFGMASDAHGQSILLHDLFDDNSVLTNDKGPGTGWSKEMQGTSYGKKQDVIEEKNLLRFTKAGDVHRNIEPKGSDHDNVQLRSKDEFTFFDNPGVTIEYVLTNAMASGKNAKAWTAKMAPDHPGCSSADWFISYGLVAKGEGDIHRNKNGGLYVQIYYKSNGAEEFNGRKESRDLDVLGNIRIVNRSKSTDGQNESIEGLFTPTTFSFPEYNGQDDLIVTLKVNAHRWEVSFNKQVKLSKGSLTGEWRDSNSGALITTEFVNGARNFVMARKMANGYGTADMKYLKVTREGVTTELNQIIAPEVQNPAERLFLAQPSNAVGQSLAVSVDGRSVQATTPATSLSIALPD